MTLSVTVQAEIVRLYHAEHWRIGTMGILAKLITYSGDIDHLEAGERWWFSFSTLSDQVGSSPPCVES